MTHTHTHIHTHIRTYTVGLVWTRDQSVAEASTWQQTTLRHPNPDKIRTRNPSKQRTADPRLKSRSRWYRLTATHNSHILPDNLTWLHVEKRGFSILWPLDYSCLLIVKDYHILTCVHNFKQLAFMQTFQVQWIVLVSPISAVYLHRVIFFRDYHSTQRSFP